MSNETQYGRRRFLSTAAITIAATQLGIFSPAKAQSENTNSTSKAPFKPSANKAFDNVKQIKAGVLNMGYVEVGPANGKVVVLLHGWPYDINSFVDVAPLLVSEVTG